MSVKVGVIGAGVISDQYLENMTTFPDLDVAFVSDLDTERAGSQARKYAVPRSGTPDELLETDVELVVILTPPAAHVPVGLAAIAAGKHVWLEKPLATDPEAARDLLTAAQAAGLVVAGAPDTVLGSGIQTALRAVAEGRIGRAISAVAFFATAGPQGWHPAPDFLFAAGGGPLLDVGPYYLTTLVHLLGSITHVTAQGTRSQEFRTIGAGPRAGEQFPIEVDTTINALFRFESGAQATATFSFDSGVRHAQLEVTGEQGTIIVPDPNRFAGDVKICSNRGLEPVVIEAQGTERTRGIGVVEMAQAIRSHRLPRANGALMLHVLDAMHATLDSCARSTEEPVSVAVTSRTEPVPPLPAAWDPTARTL